VKQAIFWVLFLALLLRVVAALTVQMHVEKQDRSFLIEGDANGYWELARNLANGEDYEIYTPPRRAMRMPGFPGLLALSIKLFGENLLFCRFLLAAIGTLACGMLYWLGSVLIDKRTGLIAAAVAAVSPVLVGFSVLVLTETAFAASLTASTFILACWLGFKKKKEGRQEASEGHLDRKDDSDKTNSLLLAGVGGVAAGIACYVRPSWLLFAPAVCAFAIGRAIWQERSLHSDKDSQNENKQPRSQLKQKLIESAVVLAALFVTLLPWAIRNQSATGHFVLTTLWVGPSLYDGLSETATGESDMKFFDQENLLGSMTEYEMDREYRRRAWSFVGENPVRAIQLGLIKFGRFWSPVPNAKQFQSLWQTVGMAAISLPTFGLAAYGAWLSRGNLAVLLLTLGPIVYFSAIHSLFIGSIRYRLPAEYPLLVLAAVGGLAVWDKFKSRVGQIQERQDNSKRPLSP
jgi:4-amino-4-deoxy-L-arabinose transferase-like glycosyltransferase